MRHTDDTGETIAIEIEVPSLAFFAESAPPEAPGDSAMVAASLSEVGALVPGREAWSQSSGASAHATDGVRAESPAGTSRFQFRLPIPDIGQSRAFMLNVLRTQTALNGSGTRRNPHLYPTEQILISVVSTQQSGQDDHQQAPMSPVPDRQGAGQFTPGVNVVRAVTHAASEDAPAQADSSGALTLEIQGA